MSDRDKSLHMQFGILQLSHAGGNIPVRRVFYLHTAPVAMIDLS
jgi:hypothetical protein